MSKPLTSFYYLYTLSRVPKYNAFTATSPTYNDKDGVKYKTYEEAITAVRQALEDAREQGYCVTNDRDGGFLAYAVAHKTPTQDYIMLIAPLCTEEVGESVFPNSTFKDEHITYYYTVEDAKFDRQVKDDTLKNIRKHTVVFTEFELEMLSEIMHGYKDYNRGDSHSILSAMAVEKTLTEQTNGLYQADTTYDWK